MNIPGTLGCPNKLCEFYGQYIFDFICYNLHVILPIMWIYSSSRLADPDFSSVADEGQTIISVLRGSAGKPAWPAQKHFSMPQEQLVGPPCSLPAPLILLFVSSTASRFFCVYKFTLTQSLLPVLLPALHGLINKHSRGTGGDTLTHAILSIPSTKLRTQRQKSEWCWLGELASPQASGECRREEGWEKNPSSPTRIQLQQNKDI